MRPHSSMAEQPLAVIETLTLERVAVCHDEVVIAVAAMHRRLGTRRLDDQDAVAVRHIVEGWGKICRVELACPATWWQHLKLALRTRWPRLFGHLAVEMHKAIAENGAIVAGLGPVRARHLVIPYRVPTSFTSFTVADEDGDS